MSIANDKIVNLQDAKVLYDDLRGRIKDNSVVEVLDTPADIQSFSDAARFPMELKVGIDPVQDLHGYDHPWAGGAGKNLLPIKKTNGFTNNGITYTNDVDSDGNILGAIATGTSTGNADFWIADSSSGFSGIAEGVSVIVTAEFSSPDLATVYIYTTSGNYIPLTSQSSSLTTSNGIQGMLVRVPSGNTVSNLKVHVMIRLSTESDSTFEPYSNVCLISGWDGANISVTGKNLIKPTGFVSGVIDWNKATANSILATNAYITSDFIPISDGHNKITVSAILGNFVRFYMLDANKKTLYFRGNHPTQAEGTLTFDMVPGCKYIRFSIGVDGSTFTPSDYGTLLKAQIEYGEEGTAFEPYVGTTYDITFPSSAGTIYGGTLKIHSDGSGEVVVDHGSKDLGDLSWTYTSSNTSFASSVSDKAYGNSNLICSIYKTSNSGNISGMENHSIKGNAETNQIYVKESDYTSATTFKTAVAGQKIVYPLATPITYSLTPGQIFALLGTNNVWADCGQINYLEYVKDTVGEVIPNRFDGIEQDIVETNTYEKTISEANAIQTFEDGAEWPMEMQIAVDPVQDLHGYSNPWPGGGGKNLLPLVVEKIKAVNSGTWSGNSLTKNGVTFTINTDANGNVTGISTSGTATSNTYFVLSDSDLYSIVSGKTIILNGCPANGSSSTYEIMQYLYNPPNNMSDYGNGTSGYVVTNESSLVQIVIRSNANVSGKTFKPMLRLSTVSDSTFAPYTNICSISGFTGVNVTVTGKNWFDYVTFVENSNKQRCSATVASDGTINVTSTTTGYNWIGIGTSAGNPIPSNAFTIPVIQGDKYVGSGSGSYTVIYYECDSDGIVLGTSEIEKGSVYTISNANCTKLGFRINFGSVTSGVSYTAKIQIEKATAASEWEPYKGITYPITFPTSAGTVYGGNLTVNKDGTGTLVVDKDYFLFDGTDSEYWSGLGGSSNRYFKRTIASNRTYKANEAISNMYPQGAAASVKNVVNVNESTGGTDAVFISPSWATTESTVSDLMTYLASNNLQVVATRLTPSVYALSAPQVLSLIGKNNVWADCGDILSLTYNSKRGIEFIREDTAGQIASVVNPVKTELADAEAAIAIVVDGDTAPKNITSGQYVFVKNHSTLATGMYHATAAISSGASITGNNVEADADGIANSIIDFISKKTVDNVGLFASGNIVTLSMRGYTVASVTSNGRILRIQQSKYFPPNTITALGFAIKDSTGYRLPAIVSIIGSGEYIDIYAATLNSFSETSATNVSVGDNIYFTTSWCK